MKKTFIYLLFLCVASLWACDDDDISGKSIIIDPTQEWNEFDSWIQNNYTYPYNIDFKYRMEDIESDMNYNLIPAEYDKSIALAKLVKYLWLESYDELMGVDFLRTYVPKIIHLIGSPAYNNSGSIVLGTAEGGLKVTLYNVNNLNLKNITIASLNEAYLKTMHHEFAHILHQIKEYPTDFKDITGADYVGDDWSKADNTLAIALQKGFVSRYARKEANEDFVETIAIYITYTPTAWNNLLVQAGATGRPIIEQKFEAVKSYLATSWNINIDKLRDIVQRRSGDINKLDLTL